MTDGLIDESTVDVARQELRKVGRLEAVRRLSVLEPELHYAIGRIANEALSAVDGATNETEHAVFDAVWDATLLALAAYRLAHYRLWRGTVFGTLLDKLDPDPPAGSG